MCGIFFCIGEDELPETEALHGKCERLIKRRGPNYFNKIKMKLGDNNVFMMSSVLWLQGPQLCEQPRVDGEGNILMWNGDIFQLRGSTSEEKESDTALLSRLLSACKSSRDIVSTMGRVQGPWAMVYYHALTDTLWFGRDFFGRQSLLINKSSNRIILSSCVSKEMTQFEELPALGLYRCDLSSFKSSVNITLHPWSSLQLSKCLEMNSFECGLSDEVIQCPVDLDSRTVALLEYGGEDIKQNKLFETLLQNSQINDLVIALHSELRRAVATRMSHQPNKCKDCVGESGACSHAAIGVLFSGGLDSCLLAALAASITEQPIHLYNVAFQQPDGSFSVPDRTTGLQAFSEIKSLFPEKRLSLILVNVSLEELQEARTARVKDLLHPLDTVLDDSIGCAIWFAARGAGVDSDSGQPMESKARVLLLGMGIDEQLGGYSRHRTSFARGGWEALAAELKRELTNISSRNLGRDNRVCSDHGVAPRFPFLDENFVNFLATVPINLKCDFHFERGYGEKLILRLLAFKMGLELTSKEPKRAVQFGSKIAKMENRKEKGHQKAIRR